jgi:hypothetical protein
MGNGGERKIIGIKEALRANRKTAGYVKMVGELSYKFGREAARRIAEDLYRLNEQNTRSSLDDHLLEFDAAWTGMRKTHVAELSPKERRAYGDLETESQCDGFFIVRAWAGVAKHKKEKDFPISWASLADRLSMTGPGARKVILKLCEKVIAQTQPFVRHKQSARYCWLLPRSESKAQLPIVAGVFEAVYQTATLTEGVTT